jgi:hypothetical protein
MTLRQAQGERREPLSVEEAARIAMGGSVDDRSARRFDDPAAPNRGVVSRAIGALLNLLTACLQVVAFVLLVSVLVVVGMAVGWLLVVILVAAVALMLAAGVVALLRRARRMGETAWSR